MSESNGHGRDDQWIKIRHDLDEDPHVLRLVGALGADPDLVIGKLRRLWKYADKYTVDGMIRSAGPLEIDIIVNHLGFGMALAGVGWLEFSDTGAQVVRFHDHISQSARERALLARWREETGPITPEPSTSTKEQAAGFDDFWKVYPRKVAKAMARKAWMRLRPDTTLRAVIYKAICAQKRWDAWRKEGGAFIPYPATWLNGARWEDAEGVEPPSSEEAKERGQRIVREMEARRDAREAGVLDGAMAQLRAELRGTSTR